MNGSPVWPSRLDHLPLASDDPDALRDFYCRGLGLRAASLGERSWLLQAPGRKLLIVPGAPGARPWHGFRVQDAAQLEALRGWLHARGVATEPSPSPLFEEGAVAVRDPDGWLTAFGLPRRDLPSLTAVNDRSAHTLPARLQHVVVASSDLGAMMDFYETTLGFVPSDYVYRDPDDPASRAVAFYRTDPEHHSFAVFAASTVRADHHCYEASCWNDIRDWADHLSNEHIKLWWGPGRHGPGNNLFFMFRDPHGHQVEISAELEHMPREMAPRAWPLDDRSLNLWGTQWIRE